MSGLILQFLRNEAGESEGLSDAGIETFRDAPYASCAREAGQNSRDAMRALPVHLQFSLFSVTPQEFPDFDRLERALYACNATASEEREIEFFANALALIEKPRIPVLKVADFNTTGLGGPPDEAGTPFHSLVKSTGVSTKESKTAGGSFGIGKNASFAVSDLQSVFYSTRYLDPVSRRELFAAQGKVKLVSHIDEDGIPRRFVGYWGDPNGFRAIVDERQIPDWMTREEPGTSIFCMGFRISDDWAEHMTASLVSNFFCAVHRNDMTFDVDDGRILINADTIERLLGADYIKAAADKSGDLEDLEFARMLYQCLVATDAIEEIIDIPNLGRFSVRILVQQGLPRRVGFVRNGMLITDNLRHFNQPLSRFPGSRDFIALVEPADSDANALLKRLENPAHDNFSAERIADPARRASTARGMKKLGKELRDMIRSVAGVAHTDTVVIDELAPFFANPVATDSTDPDAERNPEKYTFELSAAKQRRKAAPSPDEGEVGGRPGTGRSRGGRGGGRGPLHGRGSGGIGPHGRRVSIRLMDVRNIVRFDTDGAPRSRMLHFTTEASGTVALTTEATGLNAPEMLRIAAADHGVLTDRGLEINVTSNKRHTVLVDFQEPYDGPLEISATMVEASPEEA